MRSLRSFRNITKKFMGVFQNSFLSIRQMLKFSLGISLGILLFLLFRIILYHASFGVKLGQQIYLYSEKNIPIERTIDIIMSADDGYIQNSAATMASVLLNCDASSNFRFHILDGGITSEKKRKTISTEKSQKL